MTKKYRAQRRNEARANGIKFPWNSPKEPTAVLPSPRPNKRDRSPEADEQRAKHITMDFTDGAEGISRALIQHKLGTVHKRKPKRGWAAKRRDAPFKTFLEGDKLHKARMRHAWYRKEIEAAQRQMAAE